MTKTYSPAALAAAMADDQVNLVAALTPGGIEAQERAGQEQCLSQDRLPRDCNLTDAQLEALGFRVGPTLDALFREATLPPGWTKRGGEHALWSLCVDPRGRERAAIFYKAAFYDRRARISFGCYYRIALRGHDAQGHATQKTPTHWMYVVENADGAEVFHAGPVPYDEAYTAVGTRLEQACRLWLAATYPDWQNPFAYWEDVRHETAQDRQFSLPGEHRPVCGGSGASPRSATLCGNRIRRDGGARKPGPGSRRDH